MLNPGASVFIMGGQFAAADSPMMPRHGGGPVGEVSMFLIGLMIIGSLCAATLVWNHPLGPIEQGESARDR